jgi:ABC-type glycerol-3-phosphate transport system permease component
MMRRNPIKQNSPSAVAFLVLAIAIGISFVIPFYFMFVTSLKTNDQYLIQKLLPVFPLSLENYRWAFDKQNILRNYTNNLIILVGTLIPFLLLVMTTGFGIGKIEFRGRRISLYLISAVMILPQMVLTVPLYRELAQLRLLDSRLGLILVYLAYFGPYSAYLMTTYFRDVPDTFIEAALIDGATPWHVFWHIMAPMARPMIMTVTIIASQQIWNELTFATHSDQEFSPENYHGGDGAFKRSVRDGGSEVHGHAVSCIPAHAANLSLLPAIYPAGCPCWGH